MLSLGNTVYEMYRIASEHAPAVRKKYGFKTAQEIFEYVKRIPYQADIDAGAEEVLKSPEIAISGGDCDDKVIFAGAALTGLGIDWRIITTSSRPDKKIHHAYLEYFEDGRWKPFDATYPENIFLRENYFTKKIIWRK